MTCPICGSADTGVSRVVARFQIWKCSQCKLLWVPALDPSVLRGFYEREYFAGSQEYGYADYLATESVQRSNARLILKRLSKHRAPATGRLLDVGCAHGFLIDEACKSGLDAEGVDYSVEAANYAQRHLGRRVFVGGVHDARYPANHFDVVTSIGSIEHFSNPIEVVEEVARICKPTGLFLITTIDTCLKLFRLKPPEHLFYFSRHNLRRLLRDKGFDVEFLSIYRATHAVGEVLGLLSKLALGSRLNIDPLIARLPFQHATISLPNNEMLIVARKR